MRPGGCGGEGCRCCRGLQASGAPSAQPRPLIPPAPANSACRSPATVILVTNAVQSSEFLSAAQQEQLVAALLKGGALAATAEQQQQQQQRQSQGQQQLGQ